MEHRFINVQRPSESGMDLMEENVLSQCKNIIDDGLRQKSLIKPQYDQGKYCDKKTKNGRI